MNREKNHGINLTLLKVISVYQMLDPNTKRVFSINIYAFINMALVTITTIMTVVGLIGFVYKTDDSMDNGFKKMQMIFYIFSILSGNLKIITILYNSKMIWKLLDITHKSFLSNKCYETMYNYKLVNSWKQMLIYFRWYLLIFAITPVTWLTTPIIVNSNNANKEIQNNHTVHRVNVVNMMYPITEETYNKLYYAIYVMESVMCSYCGYSLVIFDLLIFTFLAIIATQYDMISCAYENLGLEAEGKFGKYCLYSLLLFYIYVIFFS